MITHCKLSEVMVPNSTHHHLSYFSIFCSVCVFCCVFFIHSFFFHFCFFFFCIYLCVLLCYVAVLVFFFFEKMFSLFLLSEFFFLIFASLFHSFFMLFVFFLWICSSIFQTREKIQKIVRVKKKWPNLKAQKLKELSSGNFFTRTPNSS